MCCVFSLFWAESMINQKRYLNSVLSSPLIFFKLKMKSPLRLKVIGIVEALGRILYELFSRHLLAVAKIL